MDAEKKEWCMSTRVLDVCINNGLIGTLSEENDVWRFDYEPAWAANPDGFSLSPTLNRKTLAHIDGSSNRPDQ